ncbi:aprataxin and PNK-like factor isoform X2 [Gopherus evgoodei]|uniref:aprataxin and PNK-like factor isoform X2 n=1 Tax=Gopherus evgoodei TaxID=1825980 RepID=UPI0011CF86CD|nr:aprataxin and PNK-like factor isoform X2 [Gopherus evgoodei]
MPGFELAPADGGRPVPLQPGQTVLGRGPLLGITDKRVSRKHAILEVVGDQLRIKPQDLDPGSSDAQHTLLPLELKKQLESKVHVNPCFYQSPETSHLLPLETDEWHSLSPGDSFSLLIDKYIFKVLSTHSDVESTLRKNSKIAADETANKSSSSGHPIKMSCDPFLAELTSCSNNNIQVKAHSLLERTGEIPKNETSSKSSLFSASCNENEELKPVWRKRMLPSWMLQGDLMVQSLSIPVPKRGGGVTRGRGRGKSDMEPSKSRANVQGRKRLASEERLGDIKEMEQDQGKKSKTTEEEATVPPSRDASGIPLARITRKVEEDYNKTVSQKIESSVEKSDCQLHSKRPEHRLDAKGQLSSDTNKMNGRENKDEVIHSASQQTHQDKPSHSHVPLVETQELDLNQDPEAEDFNSARSTDALQRSKQTKQKRTPCMYGSGCYRKNPLHFQQFSHPGDHDYHDMEVVSQDDDDRPECPYGTTCYRKNPQHKLEYKHSAPPETETRRTRQKTTKRGKSVLEEDSDNDGEPNEYDLNDSFLDDEEKEEYDPTDEDSDWEPDPEDKDNEDVETLLKEAQNFIKTKK